MNSKTKNRKTRVQITGMVERAFDGTSLSKGDDALVELSDGWYNAAYVIRLVDGQEVVLKIAPPPGVVAMSYEQNIMRTEVSVMRIVAQNPAIPVPRILYFDTSHTICDSDYFFIAPYQKEPETRSQNSNRAPDRRYYKRNQRLYGRIFRVPW